MLLFEENKDSKAKVIVDRMTLQAPSIPLFPSAKRDVKVGPIDVGARLCTQRPLRCSYLEESFSAFQNARFHKDFPAKSGFWQRCAETLRVEDLANRRKGNDWC